MEMLKLDNKYMDGIRSTIRKEERSCEEALQILSMFVDLRRCTLDAVDDGLIQAMKMNCAVGGSKSPVIQAYEIVPSRRNKEKLYIEKAYHLLIENYYQHSECDNDGINAMFLLFRGFDPKFELTDDQISSANEELLNSINCYMERQKEIHNIHSTNSNSI